MKLLIKAGLFISVALYLTNGLVYAQNSVQENLFNGLEHGVQGDFQKAGDEFEKILKTDPSLREVSRLLKVIRNMDQKNIKKEAVIFLFKAIVLMEKKQYDLGITSLNNAIEISPSFAAAYGYRGQIYTIKDGLLRLVGADSGELEQAIRDFTKAIEIDSNYVEAYYDRGDIYRGERKYDKAINDYSMAIEIDPKFADAYDIRGYTNYVLLNNKIEGCIDWKKACEFGECENYNTAKNGNVCP